MINFIRTNQGIEIWTDTEVQACDGRCVGSGATLEEATLDAVREIVRDLADVLREPKVILHRAGPALIAETQEAFYPRSRYGPRYEGVHVQDPNETIAHNSPSGSTGYEGRVEPKGGD